LNDRKGFAGIIAAIFMVLIALFLVSNVFMFSMERNLAFQDRAKQGNQLVLDKNNEQIVVDVPSRPIPSLNSITVPLDITDSSPLSIEIVSVWVQDLSMTANPNFKCAATTIALQPGTTIVKSVIVSITGAKSTDSNFKSWLITARGNNVTLT
jgi:hypothetical protein